MCSWVRKVKWRGSCTGDFAHARSMTSSRPPHRPMITEAPGSSTRTNSASATSMRSSGTCWNVLIDHPAEKLGDGERKLEQRSRNHAPLRFGGDAGVTESQIHSDVGDLTGRERGLIAAGARADVDHGAASPLDEAIGELFAEATPMIVVGRPQTSLRFGLVVRAQSGLDGIHRRQVLTCPA